MAGLTPLSYFRIIAGFVGIAIIAGGSLFLSQHIYPARAPSPVTEPSLTVLVMLVVNTAVFGVIMWKILRNYGRRHGP